MHECHIHVDSYDWIMKHRIVIHPNIFDMNNSCFYNFNFAHGIVFWQVDAKLPLRHSSSNLPSPSITMSIYSIEKPSSSKHMISLLNCIANDIRYRKEVIEIIALFLFCVCNCIPEVSSMIWVHELLVYWKGYVYCVQNSLSLLPIYHQMKHIL